MVAILRHRMRQCLFSVPASYANSSLECRLLDPGYFRPLGDSFSFAVELDKVVVASVPGLQRPRNPNAILRAVASVIVFAFKCVSGRWPITHVGEEVLKVVPPITNRNSSRTIGCERLHVAVPASTHHVTPDGVNTDFIASPMLRESSNGSDGFGATAGMLIALQETLFIDNAFVTAIADAMPILLSLSAWERSCCSVSDKEFAKALAC